jgi:hypothetical protein
MAEVVTGFTFTRSKRHSYPWNDYFNGKAWKLTRGTDFHCMVEGFRAAAYQAASRHGVRVQTHTPDVNTIILQAHPLETSP